MKPRSLADAVEQSRLRRRHPHLTAARETVEQGGAPGWIEVSRDFVEQQDRRLAAELRDQLGVSKDEAEEQGLLLAGGRLRCGHSLGPMSDGEILAVRTLGRSAGGGVARSIRPQNRREFVLEPSLQRD